MKSWKPAASYVALAAALALTVLASAAACMDSHLTTQDAPDSTAVVAKVTTGTGCTWVSPHDVPDLVPPTLASERRVPLFDCSGNQVGWFDFGDIEVIAVCIPPAPDGTPRRM